MTTNKQHSELKRAFLEDGMRKTHIGGQALIEGIMMRGKLNWAVAVREPSGEIYTEEHDLISGKKKNAWMAWPLVRGCVALVESLALGYKALEIAAMHAYDEEELTDAQANKNKEKALIQKTQETQPREQTDVEPYASYAVQAQGNTTLCGAESEQVAANNGAIEQGQKAPEQEKEPCSCDQAKALKKQKVGDCEQTKVSAEKEESGGFGQTEMVISMVLGLVLGIVLFIVAPAFLTNLIVGEYDSNTVLWNIVDGLLRVAVFVTYIWLIGRLEDIKRMFAYHGAEHKTIHCFEHGLPLTPENARSFPRLHVRCGTAFLIMVMVIAILVYTIVPLNPLIAAWGVPDGLPKLLLVIFVRILFLPIIAGIAYEINVKWAGSHPDSPVVKVILWPGMQMQYLTTNEPDDSMLECAIAAMNMVVAAEEREKALSNDDSSKKTETNINQQQSECGACW